MGDMSESIFEGTSYGKAAMEKFGPVAENFRIYYVGWVEERPEEWETIRITGAEFRKAETGPDQGKLSIKLKGTDKTVYVTREQARKYK